MLLRIIKNISEEDAERLIDAKEKEKFLMNLRDADFLFDDLIGKNSNFDDSYQEIKHVNTDLGKFILSEFGIVSDYYGWAYRRVRKEKMPESLVFSFRPAPIRPGVSFCIKNTDRKIFEFNSEVFYDKKRYIQDDINNIFIFPFSAFFYDKPDLCSSIHDALSSNFENFSRISSEEFVEDLISLFSIKNSYSDISNFNICSSKEKDHFMERKRVGKNWLYLGKEKFYPKKYIDSSWFEPGLKTDLWLNNNQLISYTTWYSSSYSGYDKIKEETADPEFEYFVKNNLNDWLKHIVAIANFGTEIYTKLKPRLVVANI